MCHLAWSLPKTKRRRKTVVVLDLVLAFNPHENKYLSLNDWQNAKCNFKRLAWINSNSAYTDFFSFVQQCFGEFWLYASVVKMNTVHPRQNCWGLLEVHLNMLTFLMWMWAVFCENSWQLFCMLVYVMAYLSPLKGCLCYRKLRSSSKGKCVLPQH